MNYRGLYTLYLKEVNRFLNVYNQTLVAPLINALLLLAIFTMVFNNRVEYIQGIAFEQFIIPGLIMMTVIQNAFANTSSTITFGKVLGIIIDVLIPPLSAKEVTIAYMFGGITRGVLSGLVIAISVCLLSFVLNPNLMIHIHHFGLMLFYLFFASMFMSLMGMVAGILSDSFDQMSAYTSFVITPLSFLSGTFYSIQNLPAFWQQVNHFNPFFYIIDGFRYSLTGHNDFPIHHGVIFLMIVNSLLFMLVYKLFKSGYKLKS